MRPWRYVTAAHEHVAACCTKSRGPRRFCSSIRDAACATEAQIYLDLKAVAHVKTLVWKRGKAKRSAGAQQFQRDQVSPAAARRDH